MTIFSRIRNVAFIMATAGLLLAPVQNVMARQPTKILDVSLQQNGVLAGQVVNTQGVGQANAKLVVRAQDGRVIPCQTDKTGKFVAQLNSGGTYSATYGEGTVLFRAWTNQTAPPVASKGVVLVSNSTTVAGQSCGCGQTSCNSCNSCNSCSGGGCGGGFGGCNSTLLIFGGIAVAGLAVGIAAHDNGS